MKLTICIAAVTILVGSALAQDRSTTPQTPQTGQQSQADRQSQSGQQGQASRTGQQGQMATPDNSKTANSSNKPAEMKTQTYKGVLVDASCAMPQTGSTAGTSSSSETASTSSTSSSSSSSAQTTGAANRSSDTSAKANSADRSTNAASGSCAVSANSNQFGLKMKDGRTLRFDMVGNQRAQEELKNKKKWSEAASSGKQINATVSGVINGDKLIVSSIH